MPGPWSLRYPGVDATFDDASGIFMRVAPDLADYDIADGDVDNAHADGIQFGIDWHGGRTIGVTFGIVGSTEAQMWDRFNELASHWNAAAVRATPGAVAELVSDRGRSAFGRPRKIAPSDVFPEAGMMTVETTFRQLDKLFYGEPDQLAVPFAISQGGGISLTPYTAGDGTSLIEDPPGSGLYATDGLAETPAGSGLYAPVGLAESPAGSGLYSPGAAFRWHGLKSPLVARGYTTRANTFTVGGSEPTPIVATIRGPILNPAIEVAGVFRYAAQTSLAYDETLTIDTRPGRMTVLRNGSRIASLTRNSDLLTNGLLPPGAHTLTLTGSSTAGNPTAQLEWRAATLAP